MAVFIVEVSYPFRTQLTMETFLRCPRIPFYFFSFFFFSFFLLNAFACSLAQMQPTSDLHMYAPVSHFLINSSTTVHRVPSDLGSLPEGPRFGKPSREVFLFFSSLAKNRRCTPQSPKNSKVFGFNVRDIARPPKDKWISSPSHFSSFSSPFNCCLTVVL